MKHLYCKITRIFLASVLIKCLCRKKLRLYIRGKSDEQYTCTAYPHHCSKIQGAFKSFNPIYGVIACSLKCLTKLDKYWIFSYNLTSSISHIWHFCVTGIHRSESYMNEVWKFPSPFPKPSCIFAFYVKFWFMQILYSCPNLNMVRLLPGEIWEVTKYFIPEPWHV